MGREIECKRCGFIIELRREDYEMIEEVEIKNKRVVEVYGREGKNTYKQDCPMCGASICMAGPSSIS